MRFLTLDEANVKGKTVIVRVDMNSPIDPKTGEILDDTRIRLCAPTIKELALKGAKVVVLAHQGRPGDEDFTTLEKHAEKLSQALGLHVEYFCDPICSFVVHRLRLIRPGTVVLVENVRMLAEENLKLSPQDQTKTHMVKLLSSVGHLFVNDAFGAVHRSSPSLVGLAEVLPTYAGRLMEKELKALSQAVTPARPCIYVLGGAKFDDSLKIVDNVLSKGTADAVLAGGLVANAFLAASGKNLGKPSMDFMNEKGYEKEAERAKSLLQKFGKKIRLPSDVVAEVGGQPKVVSVGEFPVDAPILDIGPKTVEDYSGIIARCKTIVANGPLGVFERNGFERGTFGVLGAMAQSQGYTILGGGHIVAAARKAGVSDKIKHLSTGGGATISLLSGEQLPVVEALDRAAERVKPSKPRA